MMQIPSLQGCAEIASVPSTDAGRSHGQGVDGTEPQFHPDRGVFGAAADEVDVVERGKCGHISINLYVLYIGQNHWKKERKYGTCAFGCSMFVPSCLVHLMWIHCNC
jgi:hypothetical protein